MKIAGRMLGRAVAAVALALMAVTAVAAKKATITIVNNSDWDIHHLFVSPADKSEWGPDQLGKETIEAKGGTYKLSDIPCDTWDIKLVDEDGDECVVEDQDLCKDESVWKITNKELLKCQGWSK